MFSNTAKAHNCSTAGVRYLPMCVHNFMNDRLIADLDEWGLYWTGSIQH